MLSLLLRLAGLDLRCGPISKVNKGLTEAVLEWEPKSGPGAGAGGDSLQLMKDSVKEELKGRGERSC